MNVQKIKIIKELAQHIYKEAFVRKRYIGSWNVRNMRSIPLNELIDKTIGGGWGEEQKTLKEQNEVYILRGTDFEEINSGNFETVPLRYETDSILKSRELREGDIVLENSVNASSRCTGRSILITKNILEQFDKPIIPASFCKLIRPKDVRLSMFIWLNISILYESGLMEYYQNIATNGIGNFQMNRFLYKHLILFEDGIKEEIIAAFNCYDTTVYTAQISNLRKTRARLMPRLISGKLQVKNRKPELIEEL